MGYKSLILFLFVVICSAYCPHPVHVTVTNIDFSKENKAFEISIKVFSDDFESIILKMKNVELNLGKANEFGESDKYICEYVRNNFSISINNDKFADKKLKFLKREVREGALWIYFRYPLSKKIDVLKVNNTLLNDLYPDMTNLVIIKLNETENGYTLNKNTTSFQINS
jgi:hypothetical protein